MRPSRIPWPECLLIWVLTGCADPGPPPAAAPVRDPVAERNLAAAEKERDDAESRLAAVRPQSREKCEFQVGDCAIEVDEQRDRLLKANRLEACKVMPDRVGKLHCMTEELTKSGKQTELAAYYARDTACLATVLACTSDIEKNAALAAVEARAAERQRQLAAKREGAAAESAASIAQAKSEYLRATLPPSQSSACEPSTDVERCLKAAEALEDGVEAEFSKDDYDPARALKLLEQFASAHSACRAPELSCLSKTLEGYGLLPEAKKLVTRNFTLLTERQEASMGVSSSARARCIGGASKEHQARIVSAYVAYAREPVVFYRMQLDRAFASLHESQVACLAGQTKIARASPPPAASSGH